MSNLKQFVFNTQNNEANNYSDIQLFLNKKIINNNNRYKITPFQKPLFNKKLLKIKLNIPKKDINLNYFNKNNKIKYNNNYNINTPRNDHNFNLEQYQDNSNQSISPHNKVLNVPNKKLNDIFSLNNSKNVNQKIILPKLQFENHKKNSFKSKEKSAVFRRHLKKISLGKALKKDINEDDDDIIQKKFKYKNFHAKSEWNVLNDINFEDFLFNKKYLKLSDINNDSSYERKYKNGAERLKEIHLQNLVNCNKLIKKMQKEVEDKKKIRNKYIELMRNDIENNIDFNFKLI